MKWKLAVLGLLIATTSFAQSSYRKSFLLYTGAATDTTAIFMADSSAILDTQRFQRLYLHIKPDKGCRVAIQIRSHGLRDTSGVSAADSNNVAVWPWRSFTTSTADTAALVQTLATLQNLPGASELVVTFPPRSVAKQWAAPAALIIPLCDTGGTFYWGRKTSIRIRLLSITEGAAPVTWTAKLEGVTW